MTPEELLRWVEKAQRCGLARYEIAAVERLERENAELRRDAERYRWLRCRDRGWTHGVHVITNSGEAMTHPRMHTVVLDAAIDAALAANGGAA